jgi:autotransporter-associated beta strand protein
MPLLAPAVALAAPITYTYTVPTPEAANTTGSPDLWSAGTGWDLAPVSAADATLVFNAPTTAITRFTSNNVATPFLLNVLTFQGTPPVGATSALTVQGNQLQFQTSGTGPFLDLNTNRGTGTHTATINNPIAIPDGLTAQGNGSSTFVLGGAVTGAGSLVKTGSSILQLNSTANAWGGSTSVSGGTLRLGTANVIPDGSAVTVSGTGLFDFNTKAETLASLAITGTGTINNTAAVITVNGALTNTSTSAGGSGAAMVVNSGGTFTANGLATFGAGSQTLVGGGNGTSLVFNGGVDLTGATLKFNTGALSKLLLKSNVTANANAASSALGNTATAVNPMDLNGGARTFTVADGAAAVDLAINLAVTNGAIVKAGPGVMTLANTSGAGGVSGDTYAGGTTVGAGTLAAQAPGALGAGNVLVTATPAANTLLDLSSTAITAAGAIADGATLTLTDDTTSTPRFARVVFGANAYDETVGALFLNGSPLAAGTYTAATLPNNISGAGSITVAPEPAGLGLLLLAGPMFLRRGRRVRAARGR